MALLLSVMGVNIVHINLVKANIADFNEKNHLSDITSQLKINHNHFLASQHNNTSINQPCELVTSEAADNFLFTLKGQHNYDIDSLAFTPDGKTLVSGSIYNKINLWDFEKRQLKRVINAGKDGVNTIAISADGSLLAAGGGFSQPETDKTIKVWNLKTGRMIFKFTGHTQGINALTFTPDGKTLISGSSDKTIKFWNLNNGKLVRTLRGHTHWVMSLAISPDGKTLASAGGAYKIDSDTAIRLWDMQTGKLLKTFPRTPEAIGILVFSPDGKTLVSSTGKLQTNTTINFWDINSGRLVNNILENAVSLIFSKDGENLLTVNSSYAVDLWNISNGKKIKNLIAGIKLDNDQNIGRIYVSAATLHPDGKTLVIGEGGVLSGYRIGIRQISFDK
ncbi:WD40 repeat domain-containing protein [Calothrix sp. UHCC 0171]|uniref:WD40 repeat domain-containing protein n=1 Tax=Calothrix sp. UHCC 0171 TaxID=3110245 RepID=UPI002B20603D|nr:WD40 repeat domain-containing protein [Calothrix sp. UHCC 0171]MEA5572810.1 WD40 repeat domain-containing protein [Calothrix sp. UHCC 0171]